MPTVRVTVMLKPGVLDAPGQAVLAGLRALGYPVEGARVGKVVELAVPEALRARVDEMCERFLANPLIETWTVEEPEAVR
ncbi:MAG: phosphoribosylformylglycinamidine synthase subunit PurS [Armatimonadota bacterium]|nr:phosphoribosylformylglycinamidine synthase subunit PurS [Armatimonadota bacterium]